MERIPVVNRIFLICGIWIVVALAGCSGKPVIRNSSEPEGISFSVFPSDAEVLVDNVLLGKASDFPDDHPLVVPVGTHLLELRAAGCTPYSRQLVVSMQPKKIEATLPRKGETPSLKEKNGPESSPVPGTLP